MHVTRNGEPFVFDFSLTDPKVIIGLFLGGLLPSFSPPSAWTQWARPPALLFARYVDKYKCIPAS